MDEHHDAVSQASESTAVDSRVGHDSFHKSPAVEVRLCIVHENIPGVMGQITGELGKRGFDINAHVMKASGSVGHQTIDIELKLPSNDMEVTERRKIMSATLDALVEQLRAMPQVLSCEIGKFGKTVQLARQTLPSTRLCIVNENLQGILGRIGAVIGGKGINILEERTRSNGPFAYNIINVEALSDATRIDDLVQSILSIPGVRTCDIGDFRPGSLAAITARTTETPIDDEHKWRSESITNLNMGETILFHDGNQVTHGAQSATLHSTGSSRSHATSPPRSAPSSHRGNRGGRGLRGALNSAGSARAKFGALIAGSNGDNKKTGSSVEHTATLSAQGIESGLYPKSPSKVVEVDLGRFSDASTDSGDVSATEQPAASFVTGKPKEVEGYYGGSKDEVSRRSQNLTLMQERERMTQDSAKLVLAMVGLPARGKSFIARKLQRFLHWKNYNVRIFNAGKYRRDHLSPVLSGQSSFYDPDNSAAKQAREGAAEEALDDMLHWLTYENGDVGIFDATNSVQTRRRRILERCASTANVVFVEVICDDEQILEENLLVKVRTSPDFQGMDLAEALKDLRARIANYTKVYESVSDDSMSYIKLFNLSSKILANKVYGRITKSMLPYMLSLHVGSRPIWIARAGLAAGSHVTEASRDPSTKSKVAPLSESGRRFASNLADWVRTALWTSSDEDNNATPDLPALGVYQRAESVSSTTNESQQSAWVSGTPSGDPQMSNKPRANSSGKNVRHGDGRVVQSALKTMVSTLPRAEETVGELELGSNVEVLTMLNPLDKGTLVGQSLETIRVRHPEFYARWEADPFRTRFPGGESYYDLMVRLESVIIEMEQQTAPVLVVSHISCIQVMLAYFLNKPITEANNIDVPFHTVVELTPVLGGGWIEKLHNLGEYY